MLSIAQIFGVLFGLVTLQKIVLLVKSLDSKSWEGQKLRFAFLTISLGCIIAGSAGVVFEYHWGGYVLLYGIGGRYCFDRRLEVTRAKLMPRKGKLLS